MRASVSHPRGSGAPGALTSREGTEGGEDPCAGPLFDTQRTRREPCGQARLEGSPPCRLRSVASRSQLAPGARAIHRGRGLLPWMSALMF